MFGSFSDSAASWEQSEDIKIVTREKERERTGIEIVNNDRYC